MRRAIGAHATARDHGFALMVDGELVPVAAIAFTDSPPTLHVRPRAMLSHVTIDFAWAPELEEPPA